MPLGVLVPSPALRAQVTAELSGRRIPAGLHYGLRGFGWRWGLLALRDVCDVLEAWDIFDDQAPIGSDPRPAVEAMDWDGSEP